MLKNSDFKNINTKLFCMNIDEISDFLNTL